MKDLEREKILDYLNISDANLPQDQESLSLPDLVDMLIDKASSAEFDNTMLGYAYNHGIPVERYEDFYSEVDETIEALSEDEETSEDFLDTIAAKYM